MYAFPQFLKKGMPWANPEPSALLGVYRYASLLITSCVYLIGPPRAPFLLKAGTMLCLIAEAYLFIRVFNSDHANSKTKRLLLLAETAGLASILVITGGLTARSRGTPLTQYCFLQPLPPFITAG